MIVRPMSACAVLLSIGSLAGAAAPHPIPLDAGTYVLDGAGKTCEDVANAGTLYFDGANLIGPHDHASRSVVRSVSKDGATYVLDTRFTAYTMDGKPVPDARADVLHIGGRTSFRLVDEASHADKGGFHRCGPLPKLVD